MNALKYVGVKGTLLCPRVHGLKDFFCISHHLVSFVGRIYTYDGSVLKFKFVKSEFNAFFTL